MTGRFFQTFLLCFILILTHLPCASAATLGPAETLEDLRAMIEEASPGDTLLISGEISMDSGASIATDSSMRITSQAGEIASLRGLRIQDASITFSNILFEDSLYIEGTSNICLSSGVRILGSDNQSALTFIGSGTLIIEPNCSISASSGNDGVFISHTGGEFYGSIEGTVQGGSGQNGGSGMLISPLLDSSAMLISGSIEGGSGVALGGRALNLYNLSGNAFVTIDGSISGGNGFIGGDAVQIISAGDTVSIGIDGSIKGGSGQSHGGCALIIMNAGGSSSFNLSGAFAGGDAIGSAAQPGTSLQLVGNSAVVRTRIDNCLLEDGRYLSSTAKPNVIQTPFYTPTPSPSPKASPRLTPIPEITSPANHVAYIITPEPPTESPRYHTKDNP